MRAAGGARRCLQLHSSLFSPHRVASCWDARWPQAVCVRNRSLLRVWGRIALEAPGAQPSPEGNPCAFSLPPRRSSLCITRSSRLLRGAASLLLQHVLFKTACAEELRVLFHLNLASLHARVRGSCDPPHPVGCPGRCHGRAGQSPRARDCPPTPRQHPCH